MIWEEIPLKPNLAEIKQIVSQLQDECRKEKITVNTIPDVKVRGSAAELALKWKVEKTAAYGFIQFCLQLKKAKIVEYRKIEGKKGKPTIIYELDSVIAFNLG